MILGASVGFGFAAFESAGYAFTALFTEQGLSLVDLVQTETAARPAGAGRPRPVDRDPRRGAVLASDHRHFAFSRRRLLSYLGVSVLHALWDVMHSIALAFTLLLTGTPSSSSCCNRATSRSRHRCRPTCSRR